MFYIIIIVAQMDLILIFFQMINKSQIKTLIKKVLILLIILKTNLKLLIQV